MKRLIAVVGLAGSGKTVVTQEFVDHGYQKIYFGDITFEIMAKRGLAKNEVNERRVREELRQKQGMAVYAELNELKIAAALKKKNVVIESLYSWEEYLYLKEKFPSLEIVAVYAPPKLRYQRLKQRKIRPLTNEESQSRDYSQIENVHQAGSITMADYTILNIGSRVKLLEDTRRIIDAKKI